RQGVLQEGPGRQAGLRDLLRRGAERGGVCRIAAARVIVLESGLCRRVAREPRVALRDLPRGPGYSSRRGRVGVLPGRAPCSIPRPGLRLPEVIQAGRPTPLVKRWTPLRGRPQRTRRVTASLQGPWEPWPWVTL